MDRDSVEKHFVLPVVKRVVETAGVRRGVTTTSYIRFLRMFVEGFSLMNLPEGFVSSRVRFGMIDKKASRVAEERLDWSVKVPSIRGDASVKMFRADMLLGVGGGAEALVARVHDTGVMESLMFIKKHVLKEYGNVDPDVGGDTDPDSADLEGVREHLRGMRGKNFLATKRMQGREEVVRHLAGIRGQVWSIGFLGQLAELEASAQAHSEDSAWRGSAPAS
jgi:hypothetical protein